MDEESTNTCVKPTEPSICSAIIKKLCSSKCCNGVNKGSSPTTEQEKGKTVDSSREKKEKKNGKNMNKIKIVLSRLKKTTAFLPKALLSSYAYEKGKKGCETCNMDKETYRSSMKSVKIIELIVDDVINKEQKEMLDKEDEQQDINEPSDTVCTKGEKKISVQFEVYCQKDIHHNLKCVLVKLQKKIGDVILQLCYCKTKKSPDDEKCKKYDVSMNVLEHLKFEYTNLTNIIIQLFKTSPPKQKNPPCICVACMKEEIVECTEMLQDLLKGCRNLKVTMRNDDVDNERCCSRDYPHVHALIQDRHVVLKFELPFELIPQCNQLKEKENEPDKPDPKIPVPERHEETDNHSALTPQWVEDEDNKLPVPEWPESEDKKPVKPELPIEPESPQVKEEPRIPIAERGEDTENLSALTPQWVEDKDDDRLPTPEWPEEKENIKSEKSLTSNTTNTSKKEHKKPDKPELPIEPESPQVKEETRIPIAERGEDKENLSALTPQWVEDKDDDRLPILEWPEEEDDIVSKKSSTSKSTNSSKKEEKEPIKPEWPQQIEDPKILQVHEREAVAEKLSALTPQWPQEEEDDDRLPIPEWPDEKDNMGSEKSLTSKTTNTSKKEQPFNADQKKLNVFCMGETKGHSLFQKQLGSEERLSGLSKTSSPNVTKVRGSAISAVDSVVLVKNRSSISGKSKMSKEVKQSDSSENTIFNARHHGTKQVLRTETKMENKSSTSLSKQQVGEILKDLGATKLINVSLSTECPKNNTPDKDFKCISDLPFSASLHSLPLDQDDLNHISQAVEKLKSNEEIVLIPDCDDEWEIEYTKEENEDKHEWHKAFSARDSTSNICIEIQTDKPVTRKRIPKSPSQKEINNLPTISEEDEDKSKKSSLSNDKSENKGLVNKTSVNKF